MIPPVFKSLTKHENMESIYPVCVSSKLAIKTLAGWEKKILDILFSCNTRTGFSDRNSGPKLCAVSIANDGMVKTFKNLLPQNQLTSDLETWHVALGTQVLP